MVRLLPRGVNLGARGALKEHTRSPRVIQVTSSSLMSSSYDVSTAYDALDDSVYDLFDLDAYCSSLSPSVSPPEPVPNSTAPVSRLKRYPKMHGHPRPSPAVVSTTSIASTSTVSPTVPAKPDKGKGRQHSTPAVPPTSPVDPSPSISTDSVELTPQQHLSFVRMLKRLDDWFA